MLSLEFLLYAVTTYCGTSPDLRSFLWRDLYDRSLATTRRRSKDDERCMLERVLEREEDTACLSYSGTVVPSGTGYMGDIPDYTADYIGRWGTVRPRGRAARNR